MRSPPLTAQEPVARSATFIPWATPPAGRRLACRIQGTRNDWIVMAQRRIVELIDDLDQTKIGEGGTLTFALNGATYEIDLNSANEDKLREALAPFMKAGRRVRPIRSRRTSSPDRDASPSSDERSAIRAWARDNGYSVSDRGRIAADIVAAFRES